MVESGLEPLAQRRPLFIFPACTHSALKHLINIVLSPLCAGPCCALYERRETLAALNELTEKEDGQAQRPLLKMIALWEAKIKGQETM